MTTAFGLMSMTACAFSETRPCHDADQLNGSTCPRVVSTRGIGLIVGQRHVALGLLDEQVLEIPNPDDCRLVIVVNRPDDLAAVQRLLAADGKDMSSVCTLDHKGVRQ